MDNASGDLRVPRPAGLGPRPAQAAGWRVRPRDEGRREQQGRQPEREERRELTEQERVELGLAIDRINGALEKSGRNQRVRLQSAEGGEILVIENLADGSTTKAFGNRVICAIDPTFIQNWLNRLERGEGLIVDREA
ncbi:MAG: hypothetical protein HY719_12255 [Planctomycetes bacterium]|nr:hypothetical protein [Planctomycetota bacterium]